MKRRGFTVLELLVCVGIIGVLMALLLPAIQKSRESANVTQCANNLRQLGLACQNFETANGGLPPLATTPTGLSWVLKILPYLEQDSLEKNYNYSLYWFDPGQKDVVTKRLKVMECPSDPVAGYMIEGAVGAVPFVAAAGDYFAATGVNPSMNWPNPTGDLTGAMGNGFNKRLGAIIDGISNTIMLGEMGGRPFAYVTGGVPNPLIGPKTGGSGAWAHNNTHALMSYTVDGFTKPGPCGVNCSNQNAIFSFHHGGAHVAFADGSVRMLRTQIDSNIAFALGTAAGGEFLSSGDF